MSRRARVFRAGGLALGILLAGTISLVVAVASGRVDFLDLYDQAASWRIARYGYHVENIQLRDRGGKRCILSVLLPDKRATTATLFVHGLADTKLSAVPFLAGRADLVAIDWPRHGASDCDGVESLEAVADTIDEAVHALALPAPREVIAISLGVPLSSLLRSPSADAHFAWIAPPLLSNPAVTELVRFILGTHDVAGTRKYMARVFTEPKEYPDFLVASILRRKLRADPLLRNLDLDDIRAHLLRIAPSRVSLLVGGRDQLTPYASFDRAMRERFKRDVIVAPHCSHDISYACVREARDFLDKYNAR